ncbi:MAG: PHP domain-containing protein [Bacteroidales bacterium]|nr:PHP domain-containing protein [Kiritimatiellia bacterium]MBQ6912179.1 PHP domain-containing protein [Bacteroidales bacterium]
MLLRCDLHNHSCLSPCGSLDQSPSGLAQLAKERGLDVVALTDHHSARNTPAFAEACARVGLLGVYGLEVATVEEVHCLALFDTPDEALAFEQVLQPHLPAFPNNPEKLGDQPIVDADDNILGFMPNYLGVATDIPFSQLRPLIEGAGGVFYPAHVDRPAFSLLSQLGRIPEGTGPVLEVSRHADADTVDRLRSDGYAVVAASDAHYPDTVASAWAVVDAADRTWPAIWEAMRARCITALHPLQATAAEKTSTTPIT